MFSFECKDKGPRKVRINKMVAIIYRITVFREVTGQRVNCGVGLGIEIPCVYNFFGCQSLINKPEELLRKN